MMDILLYLNQSLPKKNVEDAVFFFKYECPMYVGMSFERKKWSPSLILNPMYVAN